MSLLRCCLESTFSARGIAVIGVVLGVRVWRGSHGPGPAICFAPPGQFRSRALPAVVMTVKGVPMSVLVSVFVNLRTFLTCAWAALS